MDIMKLITDKKIILDTGVTAEMLINNQVNEIITPNGIYSVSLWKGSIKRVYVRGKFVDKNIYTVQVKDPINGEYPGIDYTIVGNEITEMFVW